MGEGGVTTDVSSFSQTPDSLQCKPARPSFTHWVSFRAPEPQLHVGGYPSPILQISTSQLSGESSELPGDRVHSGCMTSSIRLGPVGSGQSDIKCLCISSAPEVPTLSYSLMPALSRRPLTQPGCREGFQGRAGAAASHGEEGWPPTHARLWASTTVAQKLTL